MTTLRAIGDEVHPSCQRAAEPHKLGDEGRAAGEVEKTVVEFYTTEVQFRQVQRNERQVV